MGNSDGHAICIFFAAFQMGLANVRFVLDSLRLGYSRFMGKGSSRVADKEWSNWPFQSRYVGPCNDFSLSSGYFIPRDFLITS